MYSFTDTLDIEPVNEDDVTKEKTVFSTVDINTSVNVPFSSLNTPVFQARPLNLALTPPEPEYPDIVY